MFERENFTFREGAPTPLLDEDDERTPRSSRCGEDRLERR